MEGGENQDYLWGLNWWRTESGLSQRELADASELSQKQISRYEKCQAKPHLGSVYRLARALKCRITDLYIRHSRD